MTPEAELLVAECKRLAREYMLMRATDEELHAAIDALAALIPPSATNPASKGAAMTGYYGDTIPIADYRGKQYQPSNGTEGEMFWASWCTKCKRDKHLNGTSSGDALGNPDPDDFCQHLNDSFVDDGTPEWVFGEDGWPMCKQFLDMDTPDTVRDEFTADMFATPPQEAA